MLRLAGARYWSASLLPALLGTTLPFWLSPPEFSFRPLAAVEFLAATLLFHAGFSLLHARFREDPAPGAAGSRLAAIAAAFILPGCLLGVHLSRGLPLHRGVPEGIFIVYGVCVLVAGAIYVAPPARLWRRPFGEIVLGEGLGLLPVIGAYLVQVGDLTRTAYLGAAPLVAATLLWVWIDEIVTCEEDARRGRRTLVVVIGPRAARRIVMPALALAFYLTLGGTIFLRILSPWALAALLTLGFGWKFAGAALAPGEDLAELLETRTRAFELHLSTGVILAASSLISPAA